MFAARVSSKPIQSIDVSANGSSMAVISANVISLLELGGFSTDGSVVPIAVSQIDITPKELPPSSEPIIIPEQGRGTFGDGSNLYVLVPILALVAAAIFILARKVSKPKTKP